MPSTILSIDWKMILMGSEDWSFIIEVILRTTIMFVVVLLGLTVVGKRGVKQLSVFELVVIIGLGSAAGDPMFYKDVGLIPALLVFIIIIGLYILVTKLVGKSKKAEYFLEGKPVELIKDGRFAIENFEKSHLGQDEFFAELRLRGVSQLGQVHQSIIETSGQISVFFYDDDNTKPGLSIIPGIFKLQREVIDVEGCYSCTFCGFTQVQKPQPRVECPKCSRHFWVEASNRKRNP